jgi:hypothetical protein
MVSPVIDILVDRQRRRAWAQPAFGESLSDGGSGRESSEATIIPEAVHSPARFGQSFSR